MQSGEGGDYVIGIIFRINLILRDNQVQVKLTCVNAQSAKVRCSR